MTYSIHEMACSVNNTDETSVIASRMEEATIFYLRKLNIQKHIPSKFSCRLKLEKKWFGNS